MPTYIPMPSEIDFLMDILQSFPTFVALPSMKIRTVGIFDYLPILKYILVIYRHLFFFKNKMSFRVLAWKSVHKCLGNVAFIVV